MIKFLFYSIFIILTSIFYKKFWFHQLIIFLFILLFIKNICIGSDYLYLGYGLGIDLLSFILILLRLFIRRIIILARNKIYFINNFTQLFVCNLLFLVICLLVTFSTINLIIFYAFFELRILPILLIIIGWGYQPERIQAGVYLLFYTLFASLPIIVSLFYCYSEFCTLRFIYFTNNLENLFLYFCINIVFLVKFPMYFVHLWLPKAHVEAPIAGSMILAGIILKLGSYGVSRLIKIFLFRGLLINKYFIIIGLFGGILVSVLCISQIDIKVLIAYSSISHIRLVLAGIFTMNIIGLIGGIVIIIAHGLCSSGLFCLANIYYERSIRRNFYINKGIITLFPRIALFIFLFRANNIAAPPSLNLLGEIILINSVVSWNYYIILILFIISFFRAVYSLFLYINVQHGKRYSGLFNLFEGKVNEYLLLFLHWLPLNLFILKGELVIMWIYLNSLIKILICDIKDIYIYYFK